MTKTSVTRYNFRTFGNISACRTRNTLNWSCHISEARVLVHIHTYTHTRIIIIIRIYFDKYHRCNICISFSYRQDWMCRRNEMKILVHSWSYSSPLINCKFISLPDGHRGELQNIEENWNWASYIAGTYTSAPSHAYVYLYAHTYICTRIWFKLDRL